MVPVVSFTSDEGLTPQILKAFPSESVRRPPFQFRPRNFSQINTDSGGRSLSLPPRSGPRWGRSRSSRPPSLPGWWCRQTAPGRRCLSSARWRRAPRWWHRGLTSPRSASRTPPPASLLPGGSPGRRERRVQDGKSSQLRPTGPGLGCSSRTHLTLGLQVALVAHQQEDDAVRLDVAASLLQPVVNVLEGAAIGDVEEEQPAHGVTVVSPCDGSATTVKPLSEHKVCI